MWSNTATNSHLVDTWKTAFRVGAPKGITWATLQHIMITASFPKYYHYITNCPLIMKSAKLYLAKLIDMFHYKPVQNSTPMIQLITIPIQ